MFSNAALTIFISSVALDAIMATGATKLKVQVIHGTVYCIFLWFLLQGVFIDDRVTSNYLYEILSLMLTLRIWHKAESVRVTIDHILEWCTHFWFTLRSTNFWDYLFFNRFPEAPSYGIRCALAKRSAGSEQAQLFVDQAPQKCLWSLSQYCW